MLRDGRVFVTGGAGRLVVDPDTGRGSRDFRSSAEVYDPAADRWTTAGSMAESRAGHTASLLSDGRILVAGGRLAGTDSSGKAVAKYRATAEIYNPSEDAWSSVKAMSVPRWNHSATVLPDGTVLVAGGLNEDGLINSSEAYDPTTDEWVQKGEMEHARTGHVALSP